MSTRETILPAEPSRPGPARKAGALVLLLAACFAVAGVGSALTTPSIPTWYAGLAKPDWTPPSWLFGPVWTALYALMAVAAWLVWLRRGLVGAAWPLGLWALQLGLNLAWSGLFFALRMPGAAFAEIVLLGLAIAATIAAFARVRPLAAALLVPYLLWVSYAGALNFAIWRLNA